MRPEGRIVRARRLILAAALAATTAGAGAPAMAQAWRPETPNSRPASRLDVSRALETQIAEGLAAGRVDAEVAAFYAARAYRPLWAPGRLRLDADRMAEELGVDVSGAEDPRRLAEIELALSSAYSDRGRPAKGGDARRVALAYVDPLLTPHAGGRRAALEAAASAPALGDLLVRSPSGAGNPIYRGLERGLDQYRAQWAGLPDSPVAPGRALSAGSRGERVDQLRTRLGLPETGEAYDGMLVEAVSAFQRAHGLEPSGTADAATIKALNLGPAHYERLIEANLERARALPLSLGERYLMVDVTAGELVFYDHGQEATRMKVVVGKPSQPTPMMAGMAQHLIFNPYWNVPEDLVRTSIAPKVLAQGLAYVEGEGLEVLDDYTDNANVLDPAQVDWKAVAAGAVSVRVRQKPGPKNMMGKVKVMLPNPLGIYLHDTPHKGDFARSERMASSGCVRLEDAMRLARLLVGDDASDGASMEGGGEQQVDLAQPIPVYITYFTAMPTETGLAFRTDVYGRDAEWATGEAVATEVAASH